MQPSQRQGWRRSNDAALSTIPSMPIFAMERKKNASVGLSATNTGLSASPTTDSSDSAYNAPVVNSHAGWRNEAQPADRMAGIAPTNPFPQGSPHAATRQTTRGAPRIRQQQATTRSGALHLSDHPQPLQQAGSGGDVQSTYAHRTGNGDSTARCEGGNAMTHGWPSPVGAVNASASPSAEFFEGNGAPYYSTTRPQDHDCTNTCRCSACLQSMYIGFLFSNQRQASRHVMMARPSPYFAQTNGIPPAPPAVEPMELDRCPVYDTFGFCPYSAACYLPHVEQGEEGCGCPPLVAPAASVEEEVKRLCEKSARQLDEPLWRCDVCGNEGIDEYSTGPVGATYYYRACRACSFHCYFPQVTYLVEHIIAGVGDDYQQFKTQVDLVRARVPDEYKVPLSFEAHRVANVVFAWSLVSPMDMCDAVEAAHRVLPDMNAVVSVGSGAGYVEHVLNRVMNSDVPATQAGSVTQRRVGPSRFPTSSFDGVHPSFYGRRKIPIFAFDEIALKLTYSVHVSLGGPLAILSMNCQRTVLLLSWPPFGSPHEEQSSMAFETLEYYTQGGGRVLIYVGDVAATGDWRFHQLLFTQYKLVREYPVRREVRRWWPQEMGYVYAGNDTIGVYERRSVPAPLPQLFNCSM